MVKSITKGGGGAKSKEAPPKTEKTAPPKAPPAKKEPLKESVKHHVWAKVVQTDPAGMPIAGATYKVTQADKKIGNGVTNHTGMIHCPDVKAGSYRITLEKVKALKQPPPSKVVTAVATTTADNQTLIQLPPFNCRTLRFSAGCEHRKVTVGTLGVVANTWTTLKTKDLVAEGKRASIGLDVKTTDGNDEDTITITSDLKPEEEEKLCGKKHEIVITRDGAPVAKGVDKVSFNASYKKITGGSGAPWGTKPIRFLAAIQGCGGYTSTFDIDSYPPRQTTIALSLTKFTEKLRKLADAAKDISDFCDQWFGWKVELKTPTGMVEATWGYKEAAKSGQVVYGWSIQAGVNPLLGGSVALEFSPFSVVPKAIREHIGDIYAFFQIEGMVGITGSITKEGPDAPKGQIGPWGYLALSAGLTVRAGSKYIVGIEVSGYIRTQFKIEGGIFVEPPEIKLGIRFSWEGITIGVKWDVTVAYFFGDEGDEQCKLCDGNKTDMFTVSTNWDKPSVWG